MQIHFELEATQHIHTFHPFVLTPRLADIIIHTDYRKGYFLTIPENKGRSVLQGKRFREMHLERNGRK